MRFGLFVCAAALALSPAAAQERDFSGVHIKVEKLAPGVAVLFGAGGNIGLSYGEDGNVVIDDQFAPLTDKILAAIKSLDPDLDQAALEAAAQWIFEPGKRDGRPVDVLVTIAIAFTLK